MTDDQRKKHILDTWRISSGKRITAMLKKYWTREDIIETAKKLFDVKKETAV